MTVVPSRRRVLRISFLVDLFDVVSNLIVMLLTGSAVVFSEMAQGIADSVGSTFLVVGERRSTRPSDEKYPLGYLREAFFWSVLSAVSMLLIGAGLSAWRGYRQLTNPSPLDSSWLAIAVLGLAVLTNGYAVWIGSRSLTANGQRGLGDCLRSASRPLVKSAFVRDAIGTTTSVVGLVSLACYAVFGAVEFDAVGALVAACLLTVGALLLLSQARALIVGRSVDEELLGRIEASLGDVAGIDVVTAIVAVHSGSENISVEVNLVSTGLDTIEVEQFVDMVTAAIQQHVVEVSDVRVRFTTRQENIRTSGSVFE